MMSTVFTSRILKFVEIKFQMSLVNYELVEGEFSGCLKCHCVMWGCGDAIFR